LTLDPFLHGASDPAPGPEHGQTAASCTAVFKYYRTADEEVLALKGIDKDFPSGRVTAIVGPSGSGKSSLLRILACVDRPSDGYVRIGGVDVSDMRPRQRRALRRRSVGYVFQDPIDNLIDYLSAADQMRLAARLRGVAPEEEEIRRVLRLLDIEARIDHHPAQLSGGEQQRLAVACAVMGRPAIVVADEPTAELDSASADGVLEAIHELRTEGAAFIISSHDPRVMEAADHLLRLEHGEVVETW